MSKSSTVEGFLKAFDPNTRRLSWALRLNEVTYQDAPVKKKNWEKVTITDDLGGCTFYGYDHSYNKNGVDTKLSGGLIVNIAYTPKYYIPGDKVDKTGGKISFSLGDAVNIYDDTAFNFEQDGSKRFVAKNKYRC